MKTVKVHIKGLSPYSQSRQHDTPLENKERRDEWEIRTWREKCNVDDKGFIRIPEMAFQQALHIGAKKLNLQIPGKGKSTFTKFFLSDVLCVSTASLDVHKDAVGSITINANSDGVRGSGKRVKRTFPVVPEWSTIAEFMILDDTVTVDVFEQAFAAAGMGVGVGRFRPAKGGLNGRFEATKYDWK